MRAGGLELKSNTGGFRRRADGGSSPLCRFVSRPFDKPLRLAFTFVREVPRPSYFGALSEADFAQLLEPTARTAPLDFFGFRLGPRPGKPAACHSKRRRAMSARRAVHCHQKYLEVTLLFAPLRRRLVLIDGVGQNALHRPSFGVDNGRCHDLAQVKRHRAEWRPPKLPRPAKFDGIFAGPPQGQVAVDLVDKCAAAPRHKILALLRVFVRMACNDDCRVPRKL